MENVRSIGVAGEMRAPATGKLTITGAREGGNQLTCVGAPSRLPGARRGGDLDRARVEACGPSETERWALLSVWWVTPSAPLP